MNDLPIEITYIIVDHLGDLSLYHWLDVLHLSCVNHYFNEILWQDLSFYHQQWRRYLSTNVPDIDLRYKYYQSLKRLGLEPNDYMRLILSIKEGWDCVFHKLFQPCDYTPNQRGDPLSTYDKNNNPEDYYDEFDATDELRINVLFLATIKYGRIQMMDTILDCGAETDSHYYNSITIAIRNDRFEIFNRLIERGAKIIRDAYYPTIAIAADYGRLEMVNHLIELGEDISLNNNKALHCAIDGRHTEVAERLIEAGASYSDRDFIREVEKGHTEVVRFLLDVQKNDSPLYQDALIIACKKRTY